MSKNTLETFTEESILIISIIKWIFLATLIGALVGSMTSLFLNILDISTANVQQVSLYYFGLPLILVITTLITKHIAPDSAGHGTEKVIRAIHKDNGNIRLRIVPIKLLTTVLTIAFGGAVGKEGPAAQIGAALSSGFSKLFKFNASDQKTLVICGISAGFTAVFGTPIAGAIFAVEVLFMGNLLYGVLLPSFISGIVSFQVAHVFGIEHHHYYLTLPQQFDLKLFLITVGAGIFFGLVSAFFIEIMTAIEKGFEQLNQHVAIKAILGGAILVAIGFFISPSHLGLGHDQIEHMLAGGSIIWYAFILKIIITSITLAAGGSGGVLTPIFFVGCAAGVCFAQLLGVDPRLFAALGMVSVLGGAANTPIAACILAIELFGTSIGPYATVTCVVSFLVTGYRSMFPSQVLSAVKSQNIRIKRGEEVEHTITHYDYKTRKMMASGRSYARKIIKQKATTSRS